MPSHTKASPFSAKGRWHGEAVTEGYGRESASKAAKRRLTRSNSAGSIKCFLPEFSLSPYGMGEILRLRRKIGEFSPNAPPAPLCEKRGAYFSASTHRSLPVLCKGEVARRSRDGGVCARKTMSSSVNLRAGAVMPVFLRVAQKFRKLRGVYADFKRQREEDEVFLGQIVFATHCCGWHFAQAQNRTICGVNAPIYG